MQVAQATRPAIDEATGRFPALTVFCAFTREWALDGWLKNLEAQEYPKDHINLVFIIDGEEPEIRARLRKFAYQNGYRNYSVVMNDEAFVFHTQIRHRRKRIAEIKEQSKELIAPLPADYVIGLEDDTVFDDPTTFRKLIAPLADPKIGFNQGYQCGRWQVKYIGAWYFDDVHEPQRTETLMPDPAASPQLMQAGGFFGYATTKELYLGHEYHWSEDQPWGPDVNFGVWLSRQGYQCLVDWHLPFGHNDHGKVLWPDGGLSKLVYTRNRTTNKWTRSDYETS